MSIKINEEWHEPSIIWFVIAARKGEKKTAALNIYRRPAIRINPLNVKIVAANFSCIAKVVFVKEKRWLCQSIEAPCNALVSVLRLYSNVYRLLTVITLVFIYTHKVSCPLLTAKAKKLAYLTNGCRRRFARSSSTCFSYVGPLLAIYQPLPS